MLQRMRTARENESGFTLIELLIVIVVLGILASIVVLGLGTFRTDATKAACKADAKQVQIASDAFIAKPTNTTQTPAADVAALVSAGLLKSAPTSTGWSYNATDGSVSDSGC